MDSKKVVIIGGEGNGGVIASCIEDNRNRFNDKEWEVTGFLNDFEEKVDGFPVIGKLADLQKLIETTDFYFIWAIHLVARNYKTAEMFESANIPENRLATVVHKSAFIGKGATLCPGAFVMYNSYIGPNAHIGKCSLVMANCCIGHDTWIDDLCHCSVGAIMTGYSRLEYCSDLAVGSTIIAFKVVGKYSMVAANAVATHDIPEGEIWAGTPAKLLKPMSHE
jgi:sugar O-acyltransferase (sialic acid O-acetyltransferase NeuD family)